MEARGAFIHAAYTKRKDDDDFGQAGTLVRKVMDNAARDRLVSNVVGHLKDGVNEPVLGARSSIGGTSTRQSATASPGASKVNGSRRNSSPVSVFVQSEGEIPWRRLPRLAIPRGGRAAGSRK